MLHVAGNMHLRVNWPHLGSKTSHMALLVFGLYPRNLGMAKLRNFDDVRLAILKVCQ